MGAIIAIAAGWKPYTLSLLGYGAVGAVSSFGSYGGARTGSPGQVGAIIAAHFSGFRWAKVLISLVVPIYNEGPRIIHNLERILSAAQSEQYELELLAIDDGSADESAAEVERLAINDPRVRLLSFTRNFGKEAAVYAGLDHAQGDAVIVLDADLQHPPALIPQMVAQWQAGFQLVEAVKRQRNDPSRLDSLFARAFYSLYRRFSGFDIGGHSDFKLLDRQVVDTYLELPERYRFFRGLVNWLGIESAMLYFDVDAREGVSRWSKFGLLRYALHNVTAFSTIPLAIVTWLGCFTLGFGVLLVALTLLQKLTGHAAVGFTTVNILLILIGGSIMTSLGIIGHYVGKIYFEIKSRPIYVCKPAKRSALCNSRRS